MIIKTLTKGSFISNFILNTLKIAVYATFISVLVDPHLFLVELIVVYWILIQMYQQHKIRYIVWFYCFIFIIYNAFCYSFLVHLFFSYFRKLIILYFNCIFRQYYSCFNVIAYFSTNSDDRHRNVIDEVTKEVFTFERKSSLRINSL